MALTVADIQVILGANITAFQNNMNSAVSTVQRLQGFMTAAGTALTVGLTVPIVAMGKASVDAASNFDQSMANIRAITGATGSEMQAMSKLALQLGADTTFSATESADAMLELLKAGLSVEQVMGGGLKGALDLAAAGGIELSDAAIVASTALNAFRKDGLSVSDAADILAGAANASAASVSSLQLGLSQVSAIASGVGLSFADTSAALAIFANNGLKGSDAGTSLKTMFLRLQPSTKEQIGLFKELGLTTAQGTSAFFDQEGKVKSLAEISGLLQRSLSGMTDAQRLSTLETLFGSDAIRAANILYKEGEDGVKKLKEQIGKVSAEEVAADRMNSFQGAIEEMKGSIETAAIAIGQKLIPIILKLAGLIENVADWFIKLNPNVQNFILIALGVFAALGPVLLILGGITAAMSALAPVALLLGTTVGGLAAAFLLVPLAIAAVISIGLALIKNWDQIKEKAAKDWREITDTISTFLFGSKEDIDTFSNDSMTSWSKWLENLKNKTSTDWKDVKTSISNALIASDTVINDNVRSWGESFTKWLNDTDSSFATTMPRIGASIQTFMTNSDTNINNFVTKAGESFTKWLNDTDSSFADTLPRIGASVQKFLTDSDTNINNFVIRAGDYFSNLWKRMFSDSSEELPKTEQTFNEFLYQLGFRAGETVGTVVKFFMELPVKIGIELQKTWQIISDKWSEVQTNTDAWWASIVKNVGDYLSKLPGIVGEWLTNAATTAENTARNIYYAINNWIARTITSGREWISQLPKIIGDYVNNAAAAAANTARGIYNGVVNAIAAIPGQFVNIFNSIWSYISSQYNRLYYAAANIAAGFWAGFKSKLFGSPKTKMEYAFIAMSEQAKQTLSDIAGLTPGYAAAGKKMMDSFGAPSTGMMGAPAYGVAGGTSGLSVPTTPMSTTPIATPEVDTGEGTWGGLSVSVAQLVVREEADVLKIAQQLYRLQKDRTRGRGQR